MLISLIGYMGSGKSHISKILSEKLNFRRIDLDKAIAEDEGMSIPEIFQKKGEIYFRKREKEILEGILDAGEDNVLSLGGGTPVYFDNIDRINEKSVSIFLRSGVGTLTERLLKQKSKRPLIARIQDEELPEFISKHLFERNPYYSKAKMIVDTDGKEDTEIVEEIIGELRTHHHLP